MKNTLPDGRVLHRYSRTAEAYHNADSVVFNDSIFGHKWQENDKIECFLVFEALSALFDREKKRLISLFTAVQKLSVGIFSLTTLAGSPNCQGVKVFRIFGEHEAKNSNPSTPPQNPLKLVFSEDFLIMERNFTAQL